MIALMLAFLFAVQHIGFSINANAQEKTTQRTETVDESTLRPTAEEIKNALPMEEAIREKEASRIKTEIISLKPTENAAPSNDMFSNGAIITGSNGSVVGTTIEATIEPGEPNVVTINKSVWYRWTAPANLSMTFEIVQNGTLTDTVMGVYTGSTVSSLTQIAWNDDINGANNRLSRVTFIANAGTTYNIQVRGFSTLEGTFLLRWQINGAESWKQFNFDGNTGSIASDFAVWRPTTGVWWIFQSSSTAIRAQAWGISSDQLVPGDYDGDGGTDIAIWRSSTGTFWVLRSLDGTVQTLNFGVNGDIPVQGDYDGDDKADFTIWRPSTGTFWIFQSTGGIRTVNWGINGDYLACGDYDGDGKTDFGIQRNSAGYAVFYILRSSDSVWDVRQFGYSTDYIVPGDYDGDGKNDVAVYRYSNNTFYYLRSSDGGFRAVQWGISGDVLAPGDYINGYATDICIWRPGDGNFYCLGDGGTGSFYVFHFGVNGDYPVARSNVH
jgi:hypothetical protein